MRMSDLIEACEYEIDADLEEAVKIGNAMFRNATKDADKKKAKQDALRKANANPHHRCPSGYVRVKGKCVPAGSRTGKVQVARNEKAAGDAGGYKVANRIADKKPSLVDRMKAMFGKK